MKYNVFFEKNADKDLRKLDNTQQRIIVNWIDKNLVRSEDPRLLGRPLKGNLKEYWRYRVGNYRIIAEINDAEIKILIIGIGHRKDVYKMP